MEKIWIAALLVYKIVCVVLVVIFSPVDIIYPKDG